MKQLILLVCLPLSVFCQNTIGLPDIINYPKQSYSAGLQNWDIRQDKNGIIYIANNEGLLSYDGRSWKLYPLPNKTIVRSVEIAPDNRIYVGGQDEVGYFSPGKTGNLEYHSLIPFIPPKDRSFGDVWDIVAHQKNIYFRSNNTIFKLTNNVMAVYKPIVEWSYLGVCNDRIYAHDYSAGLMSLENGNWSPVEKINQLPTNDPITGILPISADSILVTSLKSGMFVYSGNHISKLQSVNSALFENERIYAVTAVTKEWVALATNNSGIYITDHFGNIIQRFSVKEGIQNNNVLSIFLDRQQNLWLGLDNGIDLIVYNSAIKQINPALQHGSGYASIIHDNKLFVGTSSGLYSVPLQSMQDLSFSKGDFNTVENSKGQVWNLSAINNQLLMGHHEGAFVINNNAASKISTRNGYWNFIPLSGTFPTPGIIAGNYKGLSFFDFSNGNFVQGNEMNDFTESSRFVCIDKSEQFWISHPYHGVYKINKAANGKYQQELYTDKTGLPSTLNNHVYTIKNEVLVATEKGIYQFNQQKNKFEPAAYYQKMLGNQSIRYLKEDPSGNIWFIHEKSLGVIDFSKKEPSVINLPELNNKMLSGFECIYPVNNNNIFLGAEKGFFHINYDKYKNNMPAMQVQIRQVKISSTTDSILFGGYFKEVNEKQVQDIAAIREISSDWKTIHIEFAAPVFGYQSNIAYSFRLKGFEDNWSEWTKRTDKEYTNLPAGSYTFEVKVSNNLGNESPIAAYSFKILPPWYLTGWAKLAYALLLGIGFFLAYRWQQKKFNEQTRKYEEEQKKLLYIHELERNKTENELISLRNEKLEADINFKNSELASSAMHLVKKGELLLKIKTELSKVIKNLENPQAIAELKKVIKSMSEDDNMDKEWENFSKHFDKVQSDFLVELKEKHPNITSNELKLCAYLRMNLSSKEIAQLMNISVRGVEIGRYRLRKKLQLSSETNLFDYLIKIQTRV